MSRKSIETIAALPKNVPLVIVCGTFADAAAMKERVERENPEAAAQAQFIPLARLSNPGFSAEGAEVYYDEPTVAAVMSLDEEARLAGEEALRQSREKQEAERQRLFLDAQKRLSGEE